MRKYFVSAYYYDENYDGDVSEKMMEILDNFYNKNITKIKISNDIFGDTKNGVLKYLFIN